MQRNTVSLGYLEIEQWVKERNVNYQDCIIFCQIALLKDCTIYTPTRNVRTLISPTFTNAECH